MEETDRDRRERVRSVLIDPLIEKGMRKPKSRTGEDQEAFLDRLTRRLAYLGEGHLKTLAEAVERNAEGSARNVWPAEVSIVNWAATLEAPPDRDSRLVRSYLGSAAGLRAWNEGPTVALALRKFLRRSGRPPQPLEWHSIQRQGAEWAAEIARIEEFRRAGAMSVLQAERIEAFEALIDRVRSMVFHAGEDAA